MSISSRINALNISGLVVLGLLTILVSLYFSKENIREEIATIRTILIEERKTQLNDLIDNAYSVLSTANYYQDARNAIGNMRFGTRSHQQYQEIEQVHGSSVMMDRIIAQNSEKAGESNLAANDMKNQAKQMNSILIDLVSLVTADKKPLGPQDQVFRFANRITPWNSFDETALQNAVS